MSKSLPVPEILTGKVDPGGPSMDRTRKILVEKFFFAFLESTYFNSHKNAIKNFSTIFALYGGLALRKFFKKNFSAKNFFFVFLKSRYFNSQKNAIKNFPIIFALYGGLALRNFSKKVPKKFLNFRCEIIVMMLFLKLS